MEFIKENTEYLVNTDFVKQQNKLFAQKKESWKRNVERYYPSIDSEEAFKRIRPYRKESNMILDCAIRLLCSAQ